MLSVPLDGDCLGGFFGPDTFVALLVNDILPYQPTRYNEKGNMVSDPRRGKANPYGAAQFVNSAD